MWQHKTAGYAIEDHQLILRYRMFSRVTVWMEKRRIQSITERATYFQKRKNVSSIITTIKSGFGGATSTVPHLDKVDAEKILTWYEPIKPTPNHSSISSGEPR